MKIWSVYILNFCSYKWSACFTKNMFLYVFKGISLHFNCHLKNRFHVTEVSCYQHRVDRFVAQWWKKSPVGSCQKKSWIHLASVITNIRHYCFFGSKESHLGLENKADNNVVYFSYLQICPFTQTNGNPIKWPCSLLSLERI